MAPKKKKSQSRMDAAVAQMGLLGFEGPYVRKIVRHLLKLYGEDGWTMIEMDAYKALLDVIFDQQDQAAQTDNPLKDASSFEVAAKDASSPGKLIASPTHNAESSEVPNVTIQGLENQESSKDADFVNKHNLHSIPLNTHSANEINLQNSENTSLSLIACDDVHATVNAYTCKRKPCYGWISDDEDDDNARFLEPAPAT